MQVFTVVDVIVKQMCICITQVRLSAPGPLTSTNFPHQAPDRVRAVRRLLLHFAHRFCRLFCLGRFCGDSCRFSSSSRCCCCCRGGGRGGGRGTTRLGTFSRFMFRFVLFPCCRLLRWCSLGRGCGDHTYR